MAINDFNNGNGSSLINLSPSQRSFVDETNNMVKSFGFWDVYDDKNPFTAAMKFLNLGGARDIRLQQLNRQLDIMLQNTAIRRRVADALQSGVNPIFALGVNGAGSNAVASQPTASKKSYLDTILKLLLGITFLSK